MPQEFDVVCLGGGVAGEAIAAGLEGSGLTLVVIERELVGGECPYWGCVPSKTLLRSGETLAEAERARHLAASRIDWELDFPKVAKRVLWMARDLDDSRPAAALEKTGAKLVRGTGKLVDQRTVEVGGERFVARRSLVIANGSTATIPPIQGLETIDYWTNRQAAVPRELPISLAVLGGGAIGVELGQAFARFGCKVSIIEAGPRFLGLEEPEAGAALRPHLEADGWPADFFQVVGKAARRRRFGLQRLDALRISDVRKRAVKWSEVQSRLWLHGNPRCNGLHGRHDSGRGNISDRSRRLHKRVPQYALESRQTRSADDHTGSGRLFRHHADHLSHQ